MMTNILQNIEVSLEQPYINLYAYFGNFEIETLV